MLPLEHLDLLTTSGAIASEGERQSVFARLIAIAGHFFLSLCRGRLEDGLEQPGELCWRRNPVTWLGVARRQLDPLGWVGVGKFAIFSPAVERAD